MARKERGKKEGEGQAHTESSFYRYWLNSICFCLLAGCRPGRHSRGFPVLLCFCLWEKLNLPVSVLCSLPSPCSPTHDSELELGNLPLEKCAWSQGCCISENTRQRSFARWMPTGEVGSPCQSAAPGALLWAPTEGIFCERGSTLGWGFRVAAKPSFNPNHVPLIYRKRRKTKSPPILF